MGKIKDLLGQKFGRLTVVNRGSNTKTNQARWICVCDCRNNKEVLTTGNHLLSGHTKSCGCINKARLKSKAENLIGNIYGKLEVKEKYDNKNNKRTMWLCECMCGNKKPVIVTSLHLKNGNTKSCGCLKIETNKNRIKHGDKRGRGTRIYTIYRGMKDRCYNKNQSN